MSRPTFMTLDLAALKNNFLQVKRLAPKSRIIAMVKANAYGHGIVRMAQALTSADAFGVASLEEGIQLREAGINQPIFLMEGLFGPEELDEALRLNFTLILHHELHVSMLEKNKLTAPISVWLKINTGMHRLGFSAEEFPSVYHRVLNLNLRKPIGLMTHFAEADNIHKDTTQKQINLFYQLTQGLSGPLSLANSAGILAWPESHADWVRPGLMLYGASPFAEKNGLDHGLRPVMSLSSRLIAITQVKSGEKVGYGGTWEASHATRVGVVGVGYGDGYPQFAENNTPVLVNGEECPLVGRVSMDMLTVDLDKQPQAKIGDPVVLWGEGLPVEKVARSSKTSAYEILTRMTPRPKIQIKSIDKKEEYEKDLVKPSINV